MCRQCDDIQPTGIPALRQESWFLARCFDELAARGIRGVVSFADPVPRQTAAGAVICPGHVGTIYQATNAIYTGRGTARTIIVLPAGTTLHGDLVHPVARRVAGLEHRCARGGQLSTGVRSTGGPHASPTGPRPPRNTARLTDGDDGA